MGVLAREREGAADVLLAELPHVDSVDRHAPLGRVEEAEEEVRDGRLARAARPDERDPAPGLETEVEVGQRWRVGGRIAGGHGLERDRDRPMRERGGLAGIGDERPPVDELEDAPAGGERRRELARSSRERRHRVERRQGERERRDEHTVQRSGVVGGDRDGEDADDGEPGDEHGKRVREPGDECVAPGESRELAIAARSRARVSLRGRTRRARRAAQELDDLGGQLAASRSLTPAG